MPVLSSAREIHIDGTFKVPNIFYQLCTIHVLAHNYVFPVVYALMTNKTEEGYQLLFSYVQSLIPGLNQEVFMSDFEKGIQNAARVVFSRARISGCFFHYTQAIWRKVQKLGLTNLYNDVTIPKAKLAIKMCMALALLPQQSINEGLNQINMFINESALNSVPLDDLIRYVNRYWIGIVTPVHFSVYALIRRTNNDVESFHSMLLQRIGIHPNVWDFLAKLKNIELITRQDYTRASRGMAVRRIRKNKYVLCNEKLRDARTKLIENRITIREYLTSTSYTVPEFTLSQSIYDDDDEIVEPLAPPAPVQPPQSQRRRRLLQLRLCRGRSTTRMPTATRGRACPVLRARRSVIRPMSCGGRPPRVAPPSPPLLPPPPPPALPSPPPPSAPICVVCLNNTVNALFVPCGHMCCWECSEQLFTARRRTCPTCRGRVAARHRLT
uniref:RING-type domain-containing protein n=1 Tax=Strigamia maritima TaxID=126957 RepID=T1IKG6_STRMM